MPKVGDWFYKEHTLTAGYEEIDFELRADRIIIFSDSDVEFSWNGQDLTGKLLVADIKTTINDARKGKIWVKGAGSIRIMAWEA